MHGTRDNDATAPFAPKPAPKPVVFDINEQPEHKPVHTTKVTLLTWTNLPMESLYSVWEASKTANPLRTPEQIKAEVDPAEVRKLFLAVIKQGIPVGEHLYFVFMLENVSVGLREHIVRHRIGVSPSPERLGADIVIDVIPDRATSSFWSQSGRILNMGTFADDGAFRIPQSMLEHPNSAEIVAKWRGHMGATQDLYNYLVEQGIPMEDAREAIPIAMQHRISWSLNVQSLRHILTERGCWILQLGVWGPLIDGMIRELVEKVDPIFSMLVTPPCLVGTPDGPDHDDGTPSEWVGCRFHLENARRYTGEDKLPPCTLHATNCASTEQKDMIDTAMTQAMGEHAAKRQVFWQRDPWTGKRLAHLPVVQ